MRVRPFAPLSLLLLVCCASEQVRWGEETATTTTTTSTTAAPASTKPDKPQTAKEYAERFPTDGACESEARRIFTKKPDLALKLLDACIARGDFRRLSALVDAPWTPSLAARPEAPGWCARVVAARAGDVEADVKACARVRVPVITLEEVFSDPDKAKGALVIFRGRLDGEHPATNATETRLIETTLDEGEVETTATGRRVVARFGAERHPKRDAVMLGRVVKLSEDPLVDDGEEVAIVDIFVSAPAADRPTF